MNETNILHAMPQNSICAEIGVWRARFSNRIIQTTRPKELHLIDPWRYQPEFSKAIFGGVIDDICSQADMDKVYEEAKKLVGHHPCVRFHRANSADIYGKFPDIFFDWIYIDGNHSYEYIRADLHNFGPKIKVGGFMAGDDYCEGNWWGNDVKRAVNEFLQLGFYKMLWIKNEYFVLQRIN